MVRTDAGAPKPGHARPAGRLARAAASAAALTLVSLSTAAAVPAASAAPVPAAPAAPVPRPGYAGTLRISGVLRDGSVVTAEGLRWHAPRLPRGMTLLSFAVAYSWQRCAAGGRRCAAGADSAAAPRSEERRVGKEWRSR